MLCNHHCHCLPQHSLWNYHLHCLVHHSLWNYYLYCLLQHSLWNYDLYLFITAFALELWSLLLLISVEYSTWESLVSDIESAHPLLVHDDSRPPFRVGELLVWFNNMLLGLFLFIGLRYYWQVGIGRLGNLASKLGSVRVRLSISRLAAIAKVFGDTDPATDCEPLFAPGAGNGVCWLFSYRCGPTSDSRSPFGVCWKQCQIDNFKLLFWEQYSLMECKLTVFLRGK